MNIPEAAVTAATNAMPGAYETCTCDPGDEQLCPRCQELAVDAVEAAIRHLGEPGTECGTEYGTEITRPETGETEVHYVSGDRYWSASVGAQFIEELRPRLVQRTVIRGEWTEVQT